MVIPFCFFSCDKAEKMKNKLFPERPYEDAKIEKFYWVDSDREFLYIPLIYPYQLNTPSWKHIWTLDTVAEAIRLEVDNNVVAKISSIYPILEFNIHLSYIYGYAGVSENSSVPAYWFVFNTSNKKLQIILNDVDFKKELKKLNLPEEYLNPEEVFEQYKNDPVLPWFLEDIKKRIKEQKSTLIDQLYHPTPVDHAHHVVKKEVDISVQKINEIKKHFK